MTRKTLCAVTAILFLFVADQVFAQIRWPAYYRADTVIYPSGFGRSTIYDWRAFIVANKLEYQPGEPIFLNFTYLDGVAFNGVRQELNDVQDRFWNPHTLQAHYFPSYNFTTYERKKMLKCPQSKIAEQNSEDANLFRVYYEGIPSDTNVTTAFPLTHHRDCTLPGVYSCTNDILHGKDGQYVYENRFQANVFRIKSGPSFASSGLKNPGKWDHPAENPLEFAPVTNSPQRFFDLPPEGDYSKLKLILRSNKAKHGADEPVFVRIFLKNESETEVPVCLEPSGFWGDARFSVTDSDGNSVPKTRLGKKRFPIENRPENGIDWIFSGPGFAPSFVKIPPGREIEIGPGEILLNLYYDISRPGKYRLRIARSTLLPGQAYENPLESNELLLDTRGPALRPEDLLDPGNFETKSLP